MIAALLHGRTHLNFQEFRQQNHLTFFLHVLGILELLQPRVFQSEHQGALWDCLLSFIRLLLVGPSRSLPWIPGLHIPWGPPPTQKCSDSPVSVHLPSAPKPGLVFPNQEQWESLTP